MSHWEFDVHAMMEIRLHLSGPTSEGAAREIMSSILHGDFALYHFIKWKSRDFGGLPIPDERIIDNDPQIVAVRKSDDD